MIRRLPLLAFVCGALLAAGGAGAGSTLTGYAATKKAWYAHHKVQRLPILAPGCCFGPQQSDGQFRYYNTQYSLNRVSFYNMDFGPRISASDARKLMKKELPPDARLVAHKRRHACEQFGYRSAMDRRWVGSSR